MTVRIDGTCHALRELHKVHMVLHLNVRTIGEMGISVDNREATQIIILLGKGIKNRITIQTKIVQRNIPLIGMFTTGSTALVQGAMGRGWGDNNTPVALATHLMNPIGTLTLML